MTPKKAEVAFLIYDKTHFKPKLEETKKVTLHINKGNNPSIEDNNC
jgi:hypothetical protein